MRILGHGTDLVSTSRIAQMLADHSDRFLERCFTPGEREYQQTGRRYHEHLAARFAAKEAAMKALGTGLADGITWTEIEVVRLPSGAPMLNITGRAAAIAAQRGITQWNISLSHTDDLAIASVIASGE